MRWKIAAILAVLAVPAVLAATGTEPGGPAAGEKTVMFTLQAINSPSRINLKKLFRAEADAPKADAPKAVLITFFASWCKPCKKELPHLQSKYAELKEKGFEILAVFSEPDKTDWVREWWEGQGLTFPLVNDEYGIVKKRYGIAEYPTSYLVDATGTVVERFCGYSDAIAAAMDAAVAAQLAE